MNSQHKSFCMLLGLATIGLAISCERRPAQPATNPSSSTTATPQAAAQPDNTARNRRDVGTDAQTPMQQGESEADLRITADIRKAVVDREELSLNAKNCKIITRNGVVTLRGPVQSGAERDWIETCAKAAAGVTNVVNELEVTS